MMVSIHDFDIGKSYILTIYDLYGNHLFEYKLLSSIEEVLLPDYSGIYLAKIAKDGNLISTQKIIKF